ncbi:hypothetical protein H2203_008518 [Taxawa tesnikishii (nom. ined.)]|nr:hypothetical protein H2203_008518 [Dothideales sp. JES 119]
MERHPDKKQKFLGVIAAHGLNSQQTLATDLIVNNKDGFLLIQGSPGIGKTKSSMVLVKALAAAGYKILVTAGSNTAVAAIHERYLELISGDSDENKVCIFNSAFFKSDEQIAKLKETVDSTMTDAGAATSSTTTADAKVQSINWTDMPEHWEVINAKAMAQKALAQYGFTEKKMRLHEAWSKLDDGPLRQAAEAYSKAAQGLTLDSRGHVSREKSKAQKKARADFAAADMAMTMLAMNHMRVVFCTNSTAAHPALQEFQPDGIVSDEAAQSTPPDLMTPAAFHICGLSHGVR